MFSPKLKEALAGEMVPKFLATADSNHVPNVVPVTTLDSADDETLIFGEFMIWKTRRNLETNPKVCICVMTEDLDIWIIRANFREFVESGPYLELINSKELLRYNAYMGIRRVGVIDTLEVSASYKLSKLTVAGELLATKFARALMSTKPNCKVMPLKVREKFERSMDALKVIAYMSKDAYPQIVPSFSLMPISKTQLLFGTRIFHNELNELNSGVKVAANVLTTDPVSYQVKGRFGGITPHYIGDTGWIDIEEVYTSCPPTPGKQIV